MVRPDPKSALCLLVVACGTVDPPGKTPDPTETTPRAVEVAPLPVRPAAWSTLLQDNIAEDGLSQHHAVVRDRPDGSYAILWYRNDEPSGIFGSIYNADHQVAFEGFPVTTKAGSVKPSLAPSENGWFVAWDALDTVWTSELATDGTRLNGPIQANETPVSLEVGGHPDAATASDGSLVLSWTQTLNDPEPERLIRRRFSPDLLPLEPERVLATAPVIGRTTDVQALPDGGWVVGWSTESTNDASAVLSSFDADGIPVEDQRLDDGTDLWAPSRPNLAVNGRGQLAVGWRIQEVRDGRGAFASIFLEDSSLTAESIALGIDHEDANRTNVAVSGQTAVFAWEETLGGDIWVQAFDLGSGLAITEPFTPELDYSGPQQRTSLVLRTVDFGPVNTEYELVMVWEHKDDETGTNAVHRAVLRLVRPWAS